jgi:hypothetical protein
MAHHFEFDAENKILLLVLEGEVEGHEIREGNKEIRKHVERLKPVAGISDFTGITKFNVTSDLMRSAALQPSPYQEETPRFIVAPTDYLFGMARMYELVADRPKAMLKVLRTREAALAALGVKNAKFEPVQ